MEHPIGGGQKQLVVQGYLQLEGMVPYGKQLELDMQQVQGGLQQVQGKMQAAVVEGEASWQQQVVGGGL